MSVLLNTVGAEHLISKKKLEEKDTKTKTEKVIFTVLSVVFTNATTAFLIYSEKNMPMLVILCMIAILSGMINYLYANLDPMKSCGVSTASGG